MQKFSLKKLMAPLWNKQNRFTSLSLLIICAMYGIWMFVDAANKSAANWSPANSTQGQVVKSEGKAAIGGQFRLQRALGGDDVEIFTEQDLRGKHSLIFFGFTHCPDICPMELSKLDAVYADLSAKQRQEVQIIFVGVDSLRDTAAATFDYVTSFNEDFIPLVGNDAQIKSAADAYLVYYASRRSDESAEDYGVDHSGYTYLMGADGEFIRHFTTKSGVNEIKSGLKDAL